VTHFFAKTKAEAKGTLRGQYVEDEVSELQTAVRIRNSGLHGDLELS